MPEPTSPTTVQLHEQLSLLKEEYTKLLNDKDVLLQWGKPQLEALYLTRIGKWQLERLQVQLRIKALKRKIEMVVSAVNREIPVDVNAIELQVAVELAGAEQAIMQQAAQLEGAKNLLANLDTPQRSAELRTLFRQFAKQLHPDVNPGLTEQQEKLWLMAKEAYACGDLEKLKALQLVYEKELQAAGEAVLQLSNEELQLRIAVLKEGCRVLQQQIMEIRSVFPFTIEQQIKDEDWVAAETGRLQQELSGLQELEEELTLEYHQLIGAL